MKDEDLVENHFLEGGSVTDDQRTYVSKYLLACYLNIALASDKMGEYSVAIEACDAAIDIDERNCKAYYRRATARLAPASAGGLEQDTCSIENVASLRSAQTLTGRTRA